MNIMTYTGILMDPLDPNPEQIRMEDIAHALSMLSRANGHFPEIHTVAQHCLECANEARARKLSRRYSYFVCFMTGRKLSRRFYQSGEGTYAGVQRGGARTAHDDL